MTDEAGRADAHLNQNWRGHIALAATSRERSATARPTTVAHALRRWIAPLAFVLVGACGGNKHADMHARATDVQGACCEHLQAGSRDRCLAEIPRIDDPQVARHSTSQRTFACVAEHFVCDPKTGRPTQPSAQAQLECIQDLE
jgi:hypothetical protein